MYMTVSLYICVCAVCMPGVEGGGERGLDLLELKSQMVVSLDVSAGN